MATATITLYSFRELARWWHARQRPKTSATTTPLLLQRMRQLQAKTFHITQPKKS